MAHLPMPQPNQLPYMPVMLTNVLYSEMSERFLKAMLPRILTGLASWFFMTTDKGSWNSLYAAASNQVSFLDNGVYFTPFGKRKTPSANGLDEAQADRLWAWTDEELTKKGY